MSFPAKVNQTGPKQTRFLSLPLPVNPAPCEPAADITLITPGKIPLNLEKFRPLVPAKIMTPWAAALIQIRKRQCGGRAVPVSACQSDGQLATCSVTEAAAQIPLCLLAASLSKFRPIPRIKHLSMHCKCGREEKYCNTQTYLSNTNINARK